MLSIETIALFPDTSPMHNAILSAILSVTAKGRATSIAILIRHIVSKKNTLDRQISADGLIAENAVIGFLDFLYDPGIWR